MLKGSIAVSKKMVLAGSVLLASPLAFAEPEPGSQASAAFDALGAQVTEYAGYAWPIVISVTTIFVGIKLFKRFVGKST